MTRSLPIQLIYASTSGNVELVMEKIAEVLANEGLPTQLQRAEQTSIEVIKDNQVFVLGTSTWEHGALNPFFKSLLEAMKTTDLSGKQAVFVGLGDRRYEPVLFCAGMDMIREVWLKQGGTEIQQFLKLQGEPYGLLDTLVVPWSLKLAKKLTSSTEGSKSLFQSLKKILTHD